MKRIRAYLLFLIILSIGSHTMSATSVTYASSSVSNSEDDCHIKSKFEPLLWEKMQALMSNGTMRDLSLIIRLKTNQQVTGMQIQDLKSHAASLFTSNHKAAVYSVLRVLPVVMAKVPVTEAEKIASYDFVVSGINLVPRK